MATIMVASDAATRGLDVENVAAVISYDAPGHMKTYVHRAGRTARAGRSGTAVTLCRPGDEARAFSAMLHKVRDDGCGGGGGGGDSGARGGRPPLETVVLCQDTEVKVWAAKVRAAAAAVRRTLGAGADGAWASSTPHTHAAASAVAATGVTAAARVAAELASRNFRKRVASDANATPS